MANTEKDEREDRKYKRWIAEQQRKLERQANALAYLQQRTHEPDGEGRYLEAVKVKTRMETIGDWLVVLTLDGELGREVAFGVGDEFLDAVVATANRWSNGQLKFREDQEYEPPKSE